MMKKLILILCITFCFSCTNAQFSVSQLKGCVWDEVAPVISYRKSYISFTDTDCITSSYYVSGIVKGNVITNKNKYYLSSLRPKVFNKSLVGKNTKGKYIVTYLKGKYLRVAEIKSITKDELKIKYNNNEVFTYKKIK